LDKGGGESYLQFLGFLIHGPVIKNPVVDGVIGLAIVEDALEEDVDRFPTFETVFQTVIPFGIYEKAAIPNHLIPGQPEFLGVVVPLALKHQIEKENGIRLHRDFIAGTVFVAFEILPDITVWMSFREAVILEPERVLKEIDVVFY